MIMAETALGRMTKKSPVGAYESFGKSKWLSFGGWINAVIPILIVPYYSVIGGWVIKYLVEYLLGHGQALATDEYFSAFISNGLSTEICFIIFTMFTVVIIYAGVRNGIERVSKFMMPILVVLSLVIAVYSVSRPGAMAGVKYFLVPNMDNFSWMTVVSAMGQMFYSLSIAMGILVTFGSYMKKETSIEESTQNVEIFDTAIAIMAGLMIIPAVFAFSGGDPDTLQAGPALMFITIPKVFANMGLGTAVGILFFMLVLFAAVTSSIALTESAVSTFEDELHWSRKKATVFMAVIMILLGTLSCLGYGPLSGVTVIGMQFLDFFDFLTNSVMMPIAAIATCLLVSRVIGVAKIEQEVTDGGHPFRRKVIFQFMIQYLCPIFAAIILISSVANAFGWISMYIHPSFCACDLLQLRDRKLHRTMVVSRCRVHCRKLFQTLIQIHLDPLVDPKGAHTTRCMADPRFYLIKRDHLRLYMKCIFIFVVIDLCRPFRQDQDGFFTL